MDQYKNRWKYQNLIQKFCIRETLNLSQCADSSTDTKKILNSLQKYCGGAVTFLFQEEGQRIWGPQGLVTRNIFCSWRRAYVFVDLKGLQHITFSVPGGGTMPQSLGPYRFLLWRHSIFSFLGNDFQMWEMIWDLSFKFHIHMVAFTFGCHTNNPHGSRQCRLSYK